MHDKRAWSFALALAAGSALSPATAYAGVVSVTQQSYDALGRVQCVAVRMNTAEFGSLTDDACALDTEGSQGPDRITHNVYDDAGELTQVQRAYGTALQQNYATYTYTLNGKRASVVDANSNRSAYVYDGLDRLCRLYFPSATLGANQANTGGIAESALTCASGGTSPDYEGYAYDPNNNRTGLRLRSTETIAYTYDALNRETLKDIPGGTSEDVYSAYDALGHRLYAHFASSGGSGIDYAYDGIGRLSSETSYGQALSFQYDPASNRTRITYPDALYVQYTYDAANRMLNVEENSATSGAGLLAIYAYDEIGRRHTITRGNGAVTTFGYDGVSRLTSLGQDLPATDNDQTLTFGYTSASQIASRGATNDAYHWAAPAVSATYTRNGLNQYTSVGGVTFSYAGSDGQRGNLTSDGSRSFDYDLENRLISVSGSASLTLGYDPLGRLHQTTASSTTTSYLYDGDHLIGEYNGSTLTERYVHGAGVDEPLVWYHGAGATDRRYLIADDQGSIIAESGSSTLRYKYGPYGEPNAWLGSRFRYTGQIALPEMQLYHYKARVYDPIIGRFLQTDPVGYQTDPNLYLYVGNDPLNHADPDGRCYPVCTMLIGAGVGFAFETGVQLFMHHGDVSKVSWTTVAVATVAGGAVGLTGGAAAGVVALTGTTGAAAVATVAIPTATVAATGAAVTTMVGNQAEGRPIPEHVLRNAAVAAVTAPVGGRAGDAAVGAFERSVTRGGGEVLTSGRAAIQSGAAVATESVARQTQNAMDQSENQRQRDPRRPQ